MAGAAAAGCISSRPARASQLLASSVQRPTPLASSRVEGGLVDGIADGLERRLGILAVPPRCAAQLGQQLVAAGQMGERRLE